MKKTKFEYLTEEGFGLTIGVETTGNEEGKGPQYKAVVNVHKAAELSELTEKDILVDLTMATGMRQVMEMMHWPEMFEVETIGFQVGMGEPGADGAPGIPGLMFGGPATEA